MTGSQPVLSRRNLKRPSNLARMQCPGCGKEVKADASAEVDTDKSGGVTIRQGGDVLHKCGAGAGAGGEGASSSGH